MIGVRACPESVLHIDATADVYVEMVKSSMTHIGFRSRLYDRTLRGRLAFREVSRAGRLNERPYLYHNADTDTERGAINNISVVEDDASLGSPSSSLTLY